MTTGATKRRSDDSREVTTPRSERQSDEARHLARQGARPLPGARRTREPRVPVLFTPLHPKAPPATIESSKPQEAYGPLCTPLSFLTQNTATEATDRHRPVASVPAGTAACSHECSESPSETRGQHTPSPSPQPPSQRGGEGREGEKRVHRGTPR